MSQEAIIDGRKVIFSVYAGSHLHGTTTPESDLDLRGVVLPKREEVLGLQRFDFLEKKHDEDVVMYSLHKFVRLLLKGNPNVHEWLWAHDYAHLTRLGREIIQNRRMFISKALFKQGLGYLNGQLRRMTHISTTRDLGAKRKKLVEKFGYDTKNAAHAVRIARELSLLAVTGELRVRRDGDREELLAIRNGSLTLDAAHRQIEKETREAERWIMNNVARIPEKVDFEKVNTWLIEATLKHVLEAGT